MPPEYRRGDVIAHCARCNSRSTFTRADREREFGSTNGPAPKDYLEVLEVQLEARKNGKPEPDLTRTLGILLRCSNCSSPALAHIACGKSTQVGAVLLSFYPRESYPPADLPEGVPDDVVHELREAERCATANAWRAGSAMLRSALEKTLIANGYTAGSLYERIEAAAADQVITAARKRRAHDEIRVLGNDVLHDPWRSVTQDEFALAHHYAQRVLEDFYDDRETVEMTLRASQRLAPAGGDESTSTPPASEDPDQ